ncbi:MAG: Spo0B domain-containing protein [Treponema sp.]|nr:Spo0B domain-containing protein [Treponema sp.]MBQ1670773.1 Spo0B domain-containing protein [Treponema sp.]MBQ2356589.1 Spo0B domain-containing protein [Treponema sp.]MBQ4025666.1 Spo0B domain-containing protein [Treponema sp.]MBQ5433550.1 Spo0B domain-containing protein [Treponema sp.]
MENKGNLTLLRKEITSTQVILIVLVTILLSAGGMIININSNNKSFNQNLQNTSALITRLYSFTKNMTQTELCVYMDSVVSSLSDVDIFSIVDKNNTRIYHTHHQLINTQYDGDHPDFSIKRSDYFTEDSTGPSGPQRRTYSAVYDEDGNYQGFIMTIQLKTSMRSVTIRTILLFLVVTIVAILIELAVCATISKKIKKEFLRFTEDFEGTKFLVDSMRANNHDFTNKLHVILGLIQIGEYEKAQNYIQNISIIQRETVTFVMRNIENPSLAALLIGKIARASECNVKFSLKENSTYKEKDIDIPSEALVTITGNLIDNALDAMNRSHKECKELSIGIYSKPGDLLLIVQDSGPGIPKDIREAIFEKGFSTKGKGRGLGLYHTKQLILSLGGEIFVESQVGKGCCFTVKLKRD